jgi:hypothetical protein
LRPFEVRVLDQGPFFDQVQHSDEANMPKTARKRASKKAALRLTQRDREVLLGFLIMDQYLEDRLKQTPSDQEDVFFTLEELRDFFGWFC